MQEWLSIVSIICGFLSPIIVGYISYKAQVYNKKAKEVKDAEEKEKKLHEKELKDTLKDISDGIGALSTKLNAIETKVGELAEHNEEQDQAIRQLFRSSKINGQYVHELAQLVMVLSEGMRDQHLDGNITKAINQYRQFESEALNRLLNGDNDDK